MKTPLLLGLTLLCAGGAAQAQSPVGKHALTREEVRLYIWPTLVREYGDKETSYGGVMAVQYLLKNQGFFRSEPEGGFGAGTEQSVKRFQRANGLKADGVVGLQTFGRLCVRLRRGDRGQAVRALQVLLASANGDFGTVGIDGVFGPATERAVRSFQDKNGDVVDGVAGAQTWAALFNARFGDTSSNNRE